MKGLVFLVSLVLLSINTYAIEYAEGVVTKVKIFSLPPETYNANNKGLVIVYLNELEGACDSNEKRVAIGSDHPLFDAYLSLALVSKTTKTPVRIGHLETCKLRGNAWDFSVLELLE